MRIVAKELDDSSVDGSSWSCPSVLLVLVSLPKLDSTPGSGHGISRRPPLERDFKSQNALKPRRCQPMNVSGLMIAMTSMTAGQRR